MTTDALTKTQKQAVREAVARTKYQYIENQKMVTRGLEDDSDWMRGAFAGASAVLASLPAPAEGVDEVEKLKREYRPTMDRDVLHSWAADVVALLSRLECGEREGVGANGIIDRETAQTILDLINPLHGTLDEQTYDDKLKENFDAPDDYEHNVNITSRQDRDLTQAVSILYDRLRQPLPAAPVKEPSP